MPEPDGPRSLFMQAADGNFPGPFAAVLLSLAALFATSVTFAVLGESLHFIAAFGVAQVVGLGGVAALAARRVPPPHVERIGLRGFPLRLLLPLISLLPVVIIISELDNFVRLVMPPPPEASELQQQLAELTRIDSVYAAAQTLIVAVGISPVVEGFFFFGVMLQGLVARMGRVRGVFLTAVLYAIVHFPASGAPGDAIVPLASGLTIGALLALARLGSGSVLAAMGLAGAIAALHIAAAELRDVVAIPGFNAPGEHTPLWIVAPCAVTVLYGTWTLWRRAAVAEVSWPIPEPEPRDDDEGGFFF